MSKGTISRNIKKCVLCKHWNGAIGSTTIEPKPGGREFTYDTNEKQKCWKRGCMTNSMQSACPQFEFHQYVFTIDDGEHSTMLLAEEY